MFTTPLYDLPSQLAEGGRMIAPIARIMTIIDLQDGRARRREDEGLYGCVPLRDD